MALRILAIASTLLYACAPDLTALGPTISDVSPKEVNAASLTPIAITLENLALPTVVDYGSGEITSDSQVSVFVDQTEIGTTRIDAAGVVRALVPPNLDSGPHDVRVQLRDGRSVTAEGALTVVR